MYKQIVYYTDNRLEPKIMSACQDQIGKSGLTVISVSLQPIEFGENYVVEGERGALTLFKQIYLGLQKTRAPIVFFCEHDVLYHPSHFRFVPPEDDQYYYNLNVWKVRVSDGLSIRVDFCQQTSGLCAKRDLLLKHYEKRIKLVEMNGFTRATGFEPGTHGRPERVDDYKADSWESEYPNLDLRHENNMTASRWNPKLFRNKRFTKGWVEAHHIPGWGDTSNIVEKLR